MAIDNLEKLINGLNNRYILTFNKASISNMIAGTIGTRWRTAGSPPAGVLPTTAEDCNSNTVGAWKLPPISGETKMYIGEINVSQTVLGQFLLFDRLSHMGGLVGNSTGVQDVSLGIVGPATQGRCSDDGSGVLWALQGYVNLGSTATTATVTYTNQDDVSARTTTVDIPGTMRLGSVYPIMPNDDDKRIKSIQTIQLTASTDTAGNFGITARTRIAEIAIDVTVKNIIADYATLALPTLSGNECLEICMVCQTTSQGVLIGNAAIIRN